MILASLGSHALCSLQMVHRSDAYFSILYQWYQSTNRFRTAFECEYDYFLFFTNGTNGTNLWHGFRVFMSVNICSLHMLYQSTNRFRTALTITVFKMPDAVYKWFTNRLRSFPFVPVVRIVGFFDKWWSFTQWYDWWGCSDESYLFVYIAHVSCRRRVLLNW